MLDGLVSDKGGRGLIEELLKCGRGSAVNDHLYVMTLPSINGLSKSSVYSNNFITSHKKSIVFSILM